MIKRDNLFCDDLVKVFYEDLYLVDSTGRVISSREGSDRGIQNIFSIFTDSKEMTFLRDNVLIPGRHSFFLLSTCEGPVLLYCPLFLKKRVFLAIIPRISEGEVLSLIKNSLSTLILASPRMAEKLNEVSSFELNDQSRAFGRGLVAMHRLKSYSDTHGKTNDELAEMILDVSASIMDYLGCEIDWEIKGLGIFEMKNEICFDSYQHLLIALCLLIREYSSARSAKLCTLLIPRNFLERPIIVPPPTPVPPRYLCFPSDLA